MLVFLLTMFKSKKCHITLHAKIKPKNAISSSIYSKKREENVLKKYKVERKMIRPFISAGNKRTYDQVGQSVDWNNSIVFAHAVAEILKKGGKDIKKILIISVLQ